MKVFETGKLPVHIALTELYNDATPDELENRKIQEEIEHCYSAYTPRQIVFDSVVEKTQVQKEIDLSWELYYAAEDGESVRQKVDEATELAWYDNECLRDSNETGAGTDTINDYAVAKLRESYNCADRRIKTCRSKNRFRASVITAFNNSKRYSDSCFFKAVHNRRIICNPKNPYLKLWEQVKPAERMKLVPVGEFRRKKKKKNKNKKRRT